MQSTHQHPEDIPGSRFAKEFCSVCGDEIKGDDTLCLSHRFELNELEKERKEYCDKLAELSDSSDKYEIHDLKVKIAGCDDDIKKLTK